MITCQSLGYSSFVIFSISCLSVFPYSAVSAPTHASACEGNPMLDHGGTHPLPLVFVFDGSASVTPQDWEIFINFGKNIIKKLSKDFHGEGASSAFDTVKDIFTLLPPDEASSKLSYIKRDSKATVWGQALRFIAQNVIPAAKNANYSNKTVVLFITDGETHREDREMLALSSSLQKKYGAIIYAIGVTSDVRHESLHAMAHAAEPSESRPGLNDPKSRSFHFNDPSDMNTDLFIEKLTAKIRLSSCDATFTIDSPDKFCHKGIAGKPVSQDKHIPCCPTSCGTCITWKEGCYDLPNGKKDCCYYGQQGFKDTNRKCTEPGEVGCFIDPQMFTTTSSPTTMSPTLSPTSTPTTLSPTSTPTTSAPTSTPTTSSPTSTPTTSAPTSTPTTPSPTSTPTTLSPTPTPTTSTPTTLSPTTTPTSFSADNFCSNGIAGKPVSHDKHIPCCPTSCGTCITWKEGCYDLPNGKKDCCYYGQQGFKDTNRKCTEPGEVGCFIDPQMFTTTSSPTTMSPTLSPTSTPTTLSPTSTPTTLSPTSTPTTLSPTSTPTTPSPTSTPTTPSPTSTPTTSAPTSTPTTPPPTSTPTTLSPTPTPTTSAPTTLSPTTTPTSFSADNFCSNGIAGKPVSHDKHIPCCPTSCGTCITWKEGCYDLPNGKKDCCYYGQQGFKDTNRKCTEPGEVGCFIDPQMFTTTLPNSFLRTTPSSVAFSDRPTEVQKDTFSTIPTTKNIGEHPSTPVIKGTSFFMKDTSVATSKAVVGGTVATSRNAKAQTTVFSTSIPIRFSTEDKKSLELSGFLASSKGDKQASIGGGAIAGFVVAFFVCVALLMFVRNRRREGKRKQKSLNTSNIDLSLPQKVLMKTPISSRHIGARVDVAGYCHGTLKYYGPHATKSGFRCGVELDLDIGNNNGTIFNDDNSESYRYFTCSNGENYGVLVDPRKVTLLSELHRPHSQIASCSIYAKEHEIISWTSSPHVTTHINGPHESNMFSYTKKIGGRHENRMFPQNQNIPIMNAYKTPQVQNFKSNTQTHEKNNSLLLPDSQQTASKGLYGQQRVAQIQQLQRSDISSSRKQTSRSYTMPKETNLRHPQVPEIYSNKTVLPRTYAIPEERENITFPQAQINNLAFFKSKLISNLEKNATRGGEVVCTTIFNSVPVQKNAPSYRAAQHLINKDKNRYKDILPYDDTRVQIHKSTNESDYINASYVLYPPRSKQPLHFYVASQGPKTNTIDDHWNLIWQEKIPLTVMVTGFEERGRQKCAVYFPLNNGEVSTSGEFEILCKKCEAYNGFDSRVLEMTNLHNGECFTCRHVQLTAWPDHGVPTDPSSYLDFIDHLRDIRYEFKSNRMLVHCSAGIGRTGVIIVTEIALAKLRRGLVPDLPGILSVVRAQRPRLVQTPAQWVFLHQALLKYIEERLESDLIHL